MGFGYRHRGKIAVAGTCAIALAVTGCQSESNDAGTSYEVWGLDQADTREDGGGHLYIWAGADISEGSPGNATPTIIDLGDAAEAAGCDVAKRPHMALTNNTDTPTHAIISNVASGDTHFMDIDTREIVGCISTVDGFNGAGGSHAAHASVATPDDSMVIVADMNHGPDSGYLHKIRTDYSANDFELVETLPLAEFADALGTDTVRPICHEFTNDGKFAYVTLAHGGLLIVDVGSADAESPMQVTHVHEASTMPGAGCGAFPISDDLMITNGESGASGGDDFMFFHDTSRISDGEFPTPEVLELPGDDTHGTAFCTSTDGREYALSLMRVSNDINIIDLESREVVHTTTMATEFSPNPAPDLGFIRGNQMFVSLRGAQPLTAINDLTDAARTPGIAVLTVSNDCHSFTWEESDLLAMDANPNTVDVDGVEVSASDPHGMSIIER
ncbi:hypothetical protein IEU95_12470 [Hoyosella rhizosphaerae]|uniref:Uncharacterized protein n=1 Tax=Hoyosella rhizosphaerae TaxID=1755582 RepID=A0A916U6U9_9ACTN|nr:hypothetical protein [Hoyosella rhizosphaerae]MBN4927650.1 hypothetical protein [Hoyosella rhizosphaerae]GGC62773.1 hypothetical protein GCM10011410_14010 [Hoyosella rhizosphaerae]